MANESTCIIYLDHEDLLELFLHLNLFFGLVASCCFFPHDLIPNE